MNQNQRKRLRVGIIGCGRISIQHFTAVDSLETAELVCCCDIKKDRADDYAKQYHITAYTDYKEMLEKEQLDVVHVCLPHHLHVPVSMKAMEHNIHVLCEKPMAIDYESAAQAVQCAMDHHVQYGIIFQCRYNDSAVAVKKALKSGRLGKIISVSSTLTWSRPDSYYSESDWKGTWDKEGGGVVIDQAIHSIDLANWMIDDEVLSVQCLMANCGHSLMKVEDSALGLITYKNGVKYGFYCMNNYGDNEPIEIKILCEKGKIKFGYDDAYIEYEDGSREEIHQQNKKVHAKGKDYWGNQHINQITQYYQACLGLAPLEISGKEALKTHKLICDIYEMGGMRPKMKRFSK